MMMSANFNMALPQAFSNVFLRDSASQWVTDSRLSLYIHYHFITVLLACFSSFFYARLSCAVLWARREYGVYTTLWVESKSLVRLCVFVTFTDIKIDVTISTSARHLLYNLEQGFIDTFIHSSGGVTKKNTIYICGSIINIEKYFLHDQQKTWLLPLDINRTFVHFHTSCIPVHG